VLDFAAKSDGKKNNKLGAAVKASAFDDWDDDDEVFSFIHCVGRCVDQVCFDLCAGQRRRGARRSAETKGGRKYVFKEQGMLLEKKRDWLSKKWGKKGSTSASGSSRLAYVEAEEQGGYSSKSTARKEEPKPEILFSEEGFRLKRKPEAENAAKKKNEDSRFASSKAISSDDVKENVL
jgi:hypothetical protein